jgi:diguanylate cyclase (GGDEF)-like protein/PAS domain S-box-containing protein
MNAVCGDVQTDWRAGQATDSTISGGQVAGIMFDRVALGVGMTDMDGIFTSANPALCRFFGRSAHELLGHSPYEFMDPEDATQLSASLDDFMAGARNECKFEARFVRSNGTLAWGRVSLSAVLDAEGHGKYIFGQVEDITATRDAEDALQFQALHDVLTGLPNRALFTDRLEQALARQAHSRSIAVLFVDLDEFKVINDAMGHDVGDRVLTEIARRLVDTARRDDTVARFGGDEFIIMSEVRSPADAGHIARRMLARISAPIQLPELTLSVTASVGVTIAGPSSTTVELVRNADTAMHRAKKNGRERVEIFTTAMGQQASNRLENVLALRRTLDRDELMVAYQPVVRIADDSVAGVEALVRWHDPKRGWISPTDFIPLAEETGQIFRVGAAVLEIALRDIHEIRATVAGASDLTVAVNLSAKQFNDSELPGAIVAALQRAALPTGALHLEITETAVMGDIGTALPILMRLRDLGLKVDIDDFGTGYSSLNYLKQLPVTALKIDRTFVSGLGTDPNDRAIVKAIIALAQALGLSTIAEGVESTPQLEELRRLGCEFGQGHLWSCALSATDLGQWMGKRA